MSPSEKESAAQLAGTDHQHIPRSSGLAALQLPSNIIVVFWPLLACKPLTTRNRTNRIPSAFSWLDPPNEDKVRRPNPRPNQYRPPPPIGSTCFRGGDRNTSRALNFAPPNVQHAVIQCLGSCSFPALDSVYPPAVSASCHAGAQQLVRLRLIAIPRPNASAPSIISCAMASHIITLRDASELGLACCRGPRSPSHSQDNLPPSD